jgi:Zn ribbon nucleic-acid-binding protein
MGQTRRDSNQQIAAKVRGAARRRCPKCERGNALSTIEDEFIRARYCRYCDFAHGYDRVNEHWFTEGMSMAEFVSLRAGVSE